MFQQRDQASGLTERPVQDETPQVPESVAAAAGVMVGLIAGVLLGIALGIRMELRGQRLARRLDGYREAWQLFRGSTATRQGNPRAG